MAQSPPPFRHALAPDGGFFGDGIEKFCPCPTLPVRGQMKITPFSNQHHTLTIVCSTKVSKCVYYSYQYETRGFNKIWSKSPRGACKVRFIARSTGWSCRRSPDLYWHD